MTGREKPLARKRDTSGPALYGPGGVAHLTPRQAEVLELAAHGLRDKEIAAYLGISRRTVGDRFDELRERTGARNRAELAGRAVEAGLVQSATDISPGSSRTGSSQPGQEQPPSAGKRPVPRMSPEPDRVPPHHPQRVVGNKMLRSLDNESCKAHDAGMTNPAGDEKKPRALRPLPARRSGASDRGAARSQRSCEGDDTAQLVPDATAPMDQPGPLRGHLACDEPPASTQDVLDALQQVRSERGWLDSAERALIDMARRRGVTWPTIGRALGVGTAQAAQQRRKRLGAHRATDIPEG